MIFNFDHEALIMRIDNNLKNIQLALEGASVEEINEILNKITLVKRGVEEQARHPSTNKNTQKRAVRDLGVDSVVISFKDKPHQKFTRPPKYQYTSNTGEPKTWWGGGKMPKELKLAITDENGKEDRSLLEQYLIPKDQGQYRYKDTNGHICFWDGLKKPPHDLQILLNNGFTLSDFDISKKVKTKPVFLHPKHAIYRFENKKGDWIDWNPEREEMPVDLLSKITILNQPRPELLKNYLVIGKPIKLKAHS